MAVGVVDIEVLRTPCRGRERLDDRYAVGDALFIKRFDALDTGRNVEMLVIAPPPASKPSHGSPNLKPIFW
jgi:hypothetical protein